MKNNFLYPAFEHWLEKGGNIWVISDPHFSDPEMVYLRKDYIGDEEQIRRINSKVGKNDVLIILGDIGNEEKVAKLKGYKVLVMGNHDRGKTNYQRRIDRIEKISSEDFSLGDIKAIKNFFSKGELGEVENIYNQHIEIEFRDNKLFDEVYDGPLFISNKVLLSHEPINLPFVYNVHGHDHSNMCPPEHGINVCAEWINYTPISLLDIFKKGALKEVEDLHRITIDTATERKKLKERK